MAELRVCICIYKHMHMRMHIVRKSVCMYIKSCAGDGLRALLQKNQDPEKPGSPLRTALKA